MNLRTWLFATAVFVGLVLLGIALILDLRRTKEEEEEAIKRLDSTMKRTDDPNEPARWVP
jgi:hypothetical protein